MVQVTVTGREAVQVALGRHFDAVEDDLAEVIAQAAESARDRMRQDVPMDTGALHDGIEIKYSDGGLTAEVGFFDEDLYYGAFVNEGTSTQPAQPFMHMAAAAAERDIPSRLRETLGG